MLLPKQSRIAMTGVTVVCSLLLVACSPKETVQLNVIPLPAQVSASGGFLKVDSAAVFLRQSLQMSALPWMSQ